MDHIADILFWSPILINFERIGPGIRRSLGGGLYLGFGCFLVRFSWNIDPRHQAKPRRWPFFEIWLLFGLLFGAFSNVLPRKGHLNATPREKTEKPRTEIYTSLQKHVFFVRECILFDVKLCKSMSKNPCMQNVAGFSLELWFPNIENTFNNFLF